MNDGRDQSELLRAYRRGEQRAAEQLYAALSPALTAYAQSVLRDRALAEDAVQSIFCRVLTRSSTEVGAVKDVRSWMMLLVRNEAITMIRKRRALDRPVRTEHAGAEARHANEVSDQHLSAAIDALPRRLREVVYLKHVAGLTFDQIALALNMNRNTAASRYRDALDRLRERLAPGRVGMEVSRV